MTYLRAFPDLLLLTLIGVWLVGWMYLHRWRPMRLVTVIDGDTYMGVDMRGKRRKLRLRRVDTPELEQRNGPEAQRFVRDLVGRKIVRVRLHGRDRYHRHLCDVHIDGRDLGLALVRAGLGYPLGKSLVLRLAA